MATLNRFPRQKSSQAEFSQIRHRPAVEARVESSVSAVHLSTMCPVFTGPAVPSFADRPKDAESLHPMDGQPSLGSVPFWGWGGMWRQENAACPRFPCENFRASQLQKWWGRYV